MTPHGLPHLQLGPYRDRETPRARETPLVRKTPRTHAACRDRKVVVSIALLVASLLPACSQPQPIDYEPVVQIGHTAAVNEFRFSPDGRWLLTVGGVSQGSPRVIQWDAETGELVRSFPASRFEFGPDGQSMLILAHEGDRVIPTLISLETGAVLHRVRAGPTISNYLNASLSTDGRYILIVWGQAVHTSELAEVALWDVAAGSMAWEPSRPLPFDAAASEWTTDFIEGGQWIVNQLRNDRQAVLFRRSIRPDGKVLATQTPLSGVSVTPSGKQILVRRWEDTGSSTDDTILWDIESAEPLKRFAEPFSDEAPFHYGPDRTWFVRGIRHKTAALCDAATGNTIREFKGHQGDIGSLALSPDGKTILTGSHDGTAILWDVDTGAVLHTWRDIGVTSALGGVVSVGYSPDGQRLLIGSSDNTALIFDSRTFEKIQVIAPPPKMGYVSVQAAYAPSGQRVVTLGRGGKWTDANASLWNAESGELVRELALPYAPPMAFSPDGRWALAWRQRGKDLSLWDLAGARQVHRFERHLSDGSTSFDDYEPNAIRGISDVRLCGWSERRAYASAGKQIAFPQEFADQLPTIAGLTPEAATWLRGFVLKTSDLWPRATGPNVWHVISPDGRYGASWRPHEHGKPPAIRLEKIGDHSPTREFVFPSDVVMPANRHIGSPTAAAFSPDGRRFASAIVSASRVAVAMMWDVESGDAVWRVDNPFNREHVGVSQIVFSPNGRYLAVGMGSKASLVVLDAASGKKMLATDGAVTFSPDGTFAYVRGDAETLWNVPQGAMVRDFGTRMSTTTFVFSPNERFIWHRKSTGAYALLATETGQSVHTLGMPVAGIAGAAETSHRIQFGCGGTRFVTNTMEQLWDAENRTSLWNFNTGEKVCDFLLPDGGIVRNATFTPAARQLVTVFQNPLKPDETATYDRCQTGLMTWDAETGKLLAAAKASPRWTSTQTKRLLFTRDGDRCLTVHQDAVILWAVNSATPLRVFPEPGTSTLTAILSPDEQSLLTVAPGQRATLWQLATGERVQEFREDRQARHGAAEAIWTTDARFTEDGLNIITLSHDGRGVHVTNIATGRHLGSFFLLDDGDQAVSVTPGAKASGTSRALLRYRRIGTNQLVPRLPEEFLRAGGPATAE